MKVLLDTNILIDYLNGVEAAREEIGQYPAPMISRNSKDFPADSPGVRIPYRL